MKRLWFILFVISLVVAQQNEVITDRYPSGVKKSITVYEGKGSQENLVKKLGFYESGNLMFDTEWENGKRNGLVFVYFETGEMGISGFFKNDSLHGSIDIFDNNGNGRITVVLEIKKYFMPEWIQAIEDSVEKQAMMDMMGLPKNLQTSRYVGKSLIVLYNTKGEPIADKSYDDVEDYYEISTLYFKDETSLAFFLNELSKYNYDYFAWEKSIDGFEVSK